jgi:hypothetical protein
LAYASRTAWRSSARAAPAVATSASSCSAAVGSACFGFVSNTACCSCCYLTCLQIETT